MSTIGIHCDSFAPSVDEDIPFTGKMSVADYVETLASLKASAAMNALASEHKYDFLIAADTVITFEGKIFGKPTSRAEAIATLKKLSGQTHEVLTGVCLIAFDANGDKKSVVFHEATLVKMAVLDEDTITAYVESGEPMDKAGAYGIQGRGCSLIERIEGDYFNVVGLPCHKLCAHIRELCCK